MAKKDNEIKALRKENSELNQRLKEIEMEKKKPSRSKLRYANKERAGISLVNSGPVSLCNDGEADSDLLTTRKLMENYLSPTNDQRKDHIKEINNLKAS